MKIPLAKPVFDEEMKDAALGALRVERLVLGEGVFRFEEEFAGYCGTRYAVSTSSGTSALHLSLLALGVKSFFYYEFVALNDFEGKLREEVHA